MSKETDHHHLGLHLPGRIGSAKQRLKLTENEVHIWYLPLSLPDDLHHYAKRLLSDYQQDKYERYSCDERRRHYLASRYFLMTLLGQYTNQDAASVSLQYSRLNKPALHNNIHNIEFNLTDTHLGGQAVGVYAFTRGMEVGVDIEHLSRTSGVHNILDKRFSDAEQAYVLREDQGQNQRFLRIWTRKEAFGKATGQGINFAMREQDLYSAAHRKLFHDPQQQAWQLQQLILPDSHIACVVTRGHKPYRTQLFHQLLS